MLTATLATLLVAAVAVALWRLSDPQGGAAGIAPAPLALPTVDAPTAPAAPLRPTERQLLDVRRLPVAGRVVGADGLPARGAQVLLHRVLRSWPELRTEVIEQGYTCELGEFTFQTERGADLMLEARAPNQASGLVDAPPQLATVTLVLMHAYSVEGNVEDLAHKRLAGCEVVLEPIMRTNRMAERTRTDSSGHFVFANTAPGVVRVSARHPDFQPVTLSEVTIGGKEVLLLQFKERALHLRGVVVTEAPPQRPIAGAEVRAYASSWNAVPLETRTAKDGRFDLPGLGQGNLRLEVTHDEYSTTSRLVAMSPGPPSPPSAADLTIELPRKSQVKGMLVGDQPKAGIELCLWSPSRESARTTTDNEGRFDFPRASSLGPATLEITGGVPELCFQSSSARELEFEVEAGAPTVLQPTVVRASLLRGRVVDGAGAGIQGVLVRSPRVRRGPFKLPRLLAVSGADGWFAVPGLSGETMLLFEHDDYAVQEALANAPRPGETTTMPPVVLVKRGGITGTVTREGQPLPGAVVMASGSGRAWYYEYTGPDGRYVIRELPPGSYRLRVSYSSLSMPRAGDKDAVEVRAGQVTGPIDLGLPPGRTLTGRVTDPRGQPLGDVMVRVDGDIGSSTSSGPEGRFTLDVPRGPVQLLAFAPDLMLSASTKVEANATEAHVTLPLVPHGIVEGRVRGLPGRKVVTSAILRVEPRDGDLLEDKDGKDQPGLGDAAAAAGASGARDSAVCRAQRHVAARPVDMPGGELRVEHFPAGLSRLVLQAPGFAPFAQDVDVRPGQRLDLGTVLLEPGAALRGVVLDPDGKPVAGAGVHVGLEHDLYRNGGQTSTATDLQGRFEVHGVSRHAASIVVVAPGYAKQTVALQLPEDLLRREPLPIRLHAGSDIRVEITDTSGKPKRQCVLLLFKDQLVVEHGYPIEPGVGLFRRRAPGRYLVKVFGDDAEAWVDVVADGQVYRAALKVH